MIGAAHASYHVRERHLHKTTDTQISAVVARCCDHRAEKGKRHRIDGSKSTRRMHRPIGTMHAKNLVRYNRDMKKRFLADKQPIIASLGLGCLLTCVLCVLLGKFPFADFDEAFACQIPLTFSGDLGCLCAIIACAVMRKSNIRGSMLEGYSYAFVSAGLCLSLLTRSGSAIGQSSLSLVVGDFLTGAFMMTCAVIWWRIYASWGEQKAMLRLLFALGFAGAIFLFLTLLPQATARFVLCMVLPLATGVSLLSFSITANNEKCNEENASRKSTLPAIRNDMPQNENVGAVDAPDRTEPNSIIGIDKRAKRTSLTIAATVAMSCFTVDLAMALFPVCLFHEASPLLAPLASPSGTPNAPVGTLTQPAFLCATIVIAVSAIIYLFGRKQRIPLSLLSYIGFAMTAFDYVAFPYHSSGGIPLAIAEAGRIVIALFIIATALRLVEERESDPTWLFLKISFVAFTAMLAADALAVAVQMQPSYDYADFRFRTLFSGIGIVALVLLLLGPLPHIDKAISPTKATSREEENTPLETSLEGHFEQACAAFAADWGLSARESEVFTLIANGRDVPYIERELVLAKSTVKTHIKHIYEKCGISSRQDLLDLFDSYKN